VLPLAAAVLSVDEVLSVVGAYELGATDTMGWCSNRVGDEIADDPPAKSNRELLFCATGTGTNALISAGFAAGFAAITVVEGVLFLKIQQHTIFTKIHSYSSLILTQLIAMMWSAC
jgi:hypothetical protein